MVGDSIHRQVRAPVQLARLAHCQKCSGPLYDGADSYGAYQGCRVCGEHYPLEVDVSPVGQRAGDEPINRALPFCVTEQCRHCCNLGRHDKFR